MTIYNLLDQTSKNETFDRHIVIDPACLLGHCCRPSSYQFDYKYCNYHLSASPSATATSGPDLTKLFDPYSIYMSDCYPIDFDGITLIESLAKGVRRLERLLQDTSEKKTEIKDQVEVVSKLKEKFDHLKSDPSSSKSEMVKLKSKLVGSIGIFKSLKRQMKELIKEYSHTNQQNVQTRAMLGDYFTKHHSVGSTNSDGTINTEPYPGFKKCFDHFYYRLPQ